MLDPKLLRTDLDAITDNLARRGYTVDKTVFTEQEAQRKALQTRLQELQNQRNTASKKIGQAKAQGQDIEPLKAAIARLGDELQQTQTEFEALSTALQDWSATLPNLLHESVPAGQTEEDNVEIRRWGEPRQFDFDVHDHVDLGEGGRELNFSLATKITGSRFTVMQGGLAKLHRVLTQFMLNLHTEQHGYTEVYVPYIVNDQSLFGTGQLPKFSEDLFRVEADQSLYLIPTAEVPVTNIARDEIMDLTDGPRRYVAHTPCFRSEAGSYGRDTRGMIRQHQFEKVELVQMVEPDHSWQALEELTGHAEAVLQQLKLPYRVMTLSAGDTGFSAAKTYDLEVWLPGQQQYREISSCSNFQSFQARRMKARYRHPETGKPDYLHTLNGSGLAVGRTLVAVLENYQQADGSVTVPDVLRDAMGTDRLWSDQ